MPKQRAPIWDRRSIEVPVLVREAFNAAAFATGLHVLRVANELRANKTAKRKQENDHPEGV